MLSDCYWRNRSAQTVCAFTSYNSRSSAAQRKSVRATEQRNPRTRGIDLLSTRDLLRALNREDASIPRAIAKEIPAIARAVETMASAIGMAASVVYRRGHQRKARRFGRVRNATDLRRSPNLSQQWLPAENARWLAPSKARKILHRRARRDRRAPHHESRRRRRHYRVRLNFLRSRRAFQSSGNGAATVGITSNRNRPSRSP